jgi:phosphoribosylformylglycinamidine cyclo-ligase
MSSKNKEQMYDYKNMDPAKVLAQQVGRETAVNIERFGFKELGESRGESAHVIDIGPFYLAFTIEGLGTKNLVADEMEKLTGKSFYQEIAQDAVAMIINDLLTSGAETISVPAYFGLGDDKWLTENPERTSDLINGWAKACNIAGASYPCGETATLSGIINPETIDLVGAAIGFIRPKKRYVKPSNIKSGDAIVMVESSGIQSNGITGLRNNINKLEDGYLTKLSNGKTFGETVLTPTFIYSDLNREIFENNVLPHYIIHMTGHGWRKIMRADADFIYEINKIPTPQEEFSLVKRITGKDDKKMYNDYNMGAGFTYIVDPLDVDKVIKSADKLGYKAFEAGVVKEGIKQVNIKPLNIIFDADSMKLR